MRRMTVVFGLVALLLLSGCGDGDDQVSAGDGSTSTTTVPGGDGLALQIRTGGGFVPVEYNFAAIPEFTLYRDGRVLVTGPTTLEFPGPALPNLLEGRVDADAVATAVAGARSAGVFDEPDLGEPPIADAPTTTFTVVDGDQTATFGAYALGIEEPSGLTSAQQEARRKLQAFRDEMTRLGEAARSSYRAPAVSVLVRPYADTSGGQEPAPGSADWPLVDLGTGGVEQYDGRCLAITGADAGRVLSAAGEARSNTRWQSGGKEWALSFRPELPGEVPCTPAR